MILCLLRACSDAMVRAGTTQHPVTLPREVAVQLRTSQHSCDSSFPKYASEQRTLNPRVQRHWSSPLVTSLNLLAEARFKPRHAAGAAGPWPSAETPTVHTDHHNCAHRPS